MYWQTFSIFVSLYVKLPENDFSRGGYVELFNKQCDHWLIYLPSILYSLISWENIRFISLNRCEALPSSICWFVSFVTNKFAGYMKKAPGHLCIMQFMKSFISIRFPNFASLVVDVVTTPDVFSTPVLTSQFWYFDDLVGFREYFSFKIA